MKDVPFVCYIQMSYTIKAYFKLITDLEGHILLFFSKNKSET